MMTNRTQQSPEYMRTLRRWRYLLGKPWTNKAERQEIVELSVTLDKAELVLAKAQDYYSADERALIGNAQ